jgi:hypothetical protein
MIETPSRWSVRQRSFLALRLRRRPGDHFLKAGPVCSVVSHAAMWWFALSEALLMDFLDSVILDKSVLRQAQVGDSGGHLVQCTGLHSFRLFP